MTNRSGHSPLLRSSLLEWHARRDSNPQPAVLETAALPIELLAYGVCLSQTAKAHRYPTRLPSAFVPTSPTAKIGPASMPDNPKERLLDDLRHHAGADGAAAFADREAQAFFHRDRDGSSVTTILMLSPGITISTPSGSSHRTGHVGRAEVELRTVALEERRVTAALVLAEARTPRPRTSVCGVIEPGLHSTWPRSTSSRLVPRSSRPALSPAWPWSSSLRNISTPVHRGLHRRTDADDLDFVAHLDHAALDTARDHRAATRDREHVLDRHQERLVHVAHRLRDVAVQRVDQLDDRRHADLRLVAFQRLQRRALDDRRVVAREVVLA